MVMPEYIGYRLTQLMQAAQQGTSLPGMDDGLHIPTRAEISAHLAHIEGFAPAHLRALGYGEDTPLFDAHLSMATAAAIWRQASPNVTSDWAMETVLRDYNETILAAIITARAAGNHDQEHALASLAGDVADVRESLEQRARADDPKLRDELGRRGSFWRLHAPESTGLDGSPQAMEIAPGALGPAGLHLRHHHHASNRQATAEQEGKSGQTSQASSVRHTTSPDFQDQVRNLGVAPSTSFPVADAGKSPMADLASPDRIEAVRLETAAARSGAHLG